MDAVALVTKRLKFFYGWVIVGVALLGDMVNAGTSVYTFGLFFKPMGGEFGWNRAMVSGAVTARSMVGALLGPLVGTAVDKYGPRYVMAIGGFVAAVGLIAQFWTSSLWQFYLLYGIIGAVGASSLGGLVGSATVSKWFIRRRGRALAIEAMGISFGGIVMVPITQAAMDAFGWRWSWVALGIISFFAVVPTSLILMRRTPEDIGLLPDGDTPLPKEELGAAAGSLRAAARAEVSWNVREAARTRQFWLLIVGTNLGTLPISTIMIHQVPHMTDVGISPAIAASAVSLLALLSFSCKPIWGLLAERFHVRYCLAAVYVGTALSIILLIRVDSVFLVYAYAAFFAVSSSGLAPLTSLVWPTYFGRAFVGTIRGMISPISVVASAGAPLLTGLIFDRTSSYSVMFFFLALGLFVGATALVFNPPPRYKEAVPAPGHTGAGDANP